LVGAAYGFKCTGIIGLILKEVICSDVTNPTPWCIMMAAGFGLDKNYTLGSVGSYQCRDAIKSSMELIM